MAAPLRVEPCDEFDGGVGWVADEFMGRASHALVVDGGVWLVDPLDAGGVEARVRALGEPAGVIQLLDRHNRSCAPLAERLGVPHMRAWGPRTELPFETIPLVRRRGWREVALWWSERRVLACADALGTVGYFLAPGDRIGVHPLLRLTPPKRLGGVDPERILVGHGTGIHDRAGEALQEALRTSRRRSLGTLIGLVRARRGG